ncbi:pathogen-associated molecular patterns-induced protein A70 [Argentina anserina]|uniref:pathogen-associated molecular patterns-induced protein A70 n=1 Tax=Argentina anserina TaxID=57926 RepID=UPI0021768463|nr:pathogen-associated molecular patterns-induced protein A70 [Potentilla anserina]
MWDYMLSWLTPTSLFIFLNLTIGTIVISHRFHKTPHQEQEHSQLVGPPSLLQRVRSLDFSYYNFQPDHPELHQVTNYPENATGLVRTPSLMERLRSINFSYYNFQQPYLQEPEHVTPDNPTGLVRTPSLLERIRSFNYSFQQPDHVTEHPTPDHQTGIVRTPSLLARLKSMEFSSLYRSDPETKDLHPAEAYDAKPKQDHMVHRSKSDTGHEASERQPEKVMKKSTRERVSEENDTDDVRPRRVVEKTRSFGDDKEVDAKADDFINRFKQQLKLQRLHSLKQQLKR